MIRIIHGWFSNSGSDGPNKVLFFTEAAWFRRAGLRHRGGVAGRGAAWPSPGGVLGPKGRVLKRFLWSGGHSSAPESRAERIKKGEAEFLGFSSGRGGREGPRRGAERGENRAKLRNSGSRALARGRAGLRRGRERAPAACPLPAARCPPAACPLPAACLPARCPPAALPAPCLLPAARCLPGAGVRLPRSGRIQVCVPDRIGPQTGGRAPPASVSPPASRRALGRPKCATGPGPCPGRHRHRAQVGDAGAAPPSSPAPRAVPPLPPASPLGPGARQAGTGRAFRLSGGCTPARSRPGWAP